MRDVTLCYLVSGSSVYLAAKSRGFGAGLLNGYGGKVAEGEEVIDCVVRETLEESGVRVVKGSLVKVAVLDFFFPDVAASKGWDQRAHVYFVYDWQGHPSKTDEMEEPQLYEMANLPFDKMWSADRVWLKEVFSGKSVKASIYFNGNGESCKPYECEIVEKLD